MVRVLWERKLVSSAITPFIGFEYILYVCAEFKLFIEKPFTHLPKHTNYLIYRFKLAIRIAQTENII